MVERIWRHGTPRLLWNEQDGNVYYLNEKLVSESTYYWRVDAEIDDKTTYKGDVWSFQTI